MKTTKLGTKLPVIKLKGKEYLEVKWRLVWFREEHADWTIETNMIEGSDRHALFKTIIRNKDQIVATAHKREDKAHFGDFIEKAETGSIGRALALCGYGTQFDGGELAEGTRLADAPVEQAKRTGTAKVGVVDKDSVLSSIRQKINSLTDNYKDIARAKDIYKRMTVTGWNELKTLPVEELVKLELLVV